MVVVAAVRLVLSPGGEPILVVVLFLLAASAVGAVILISDLLSVKHRDRLSSSTFRGLALVVAVLAVTAPLLLATTGGTPVTAAQSRCGSGVVTVTRIMLAKSSARRHHGNGSPQARRRMRIVSMMSNIKEWQDGYFTTVKRVEEPVLKFAGERAETIAKFVPERPSFMAEMPTMQEFVESQLKFRKKFVDEQVAFTRKMMKAMHPVFVKLDTAPKQVEPKSAAARMAAKRPVQKVA